MDISVLASVGSFVVSERVLKPKASILVILGCVLAYDLTTKTHDVSSLRVYRGPGLLAFSLLMVAWSLRTWRRNGVACDELLFLPGTPHGEEILTPPPPTTMNNGEGDVAAGGMYHPRTPPNNRPTRTYSHDSSVSSIHEFFNSWDDESDDGMEMMEQERLIQTTPPRLVDSSVVMARSNSTIPSTPPPLDTSERSNMSMVRESTTTPSQQLLQQQQHNITRIGNLFFFRSSTSSTQSAVYAPSGPSVVGAAMDVFFPVLFNFHLFIEAFGRQDEDLAKILPIAFASVLIVRSFFPLGRRGRFWSTLSQTASAPVVRSRCRDVYLGDVLTSLIRPLQDVVFALAYYVTVIWGTVLTSRMTFTEAGVALQTSWWLHNVILPSCALLPLWWKFLQTLRECYDTGQRWPHLGQALKYLSAALVILYGMTHPEDRRSPWWILAFVAALLYQIAWDTLVDWELFVIEPRDYGDGMDVSEPSWLNRTSVSPDSHALLAFHRFCGPVRGCLRAKLARIPRLIRRIQLRPRRLYKSEKFYWRIFFFNCVFRFCWMLCFIPAYHLSSTGRFVVTTFSSDTNSYVGVLLPIAEIVRRTLWGFLYLEMKTIRMADGDPSLYTYTPVSNNTLDDQEAVPPDDSASSTDSQTKAASQLRYLLPSWLVSQQQLHHDAATTSSTSSCALWKLFNRSDWGVSETTRNHLFLVELVLWGAAFIGLGVWATT